MMIYHILFPVNFQYYYIVLSLVSLFPLCVYAFQWISRVFVNPCGIAQSSPPKCVQKRVSMDEGLSFFGLSSYENEEDTLGSSNDVPKCVYKQTNI